MSPVMYGVQQTTPNLALNQRIYNTVSLRQLRRMNECITKIHTKSPAPMSK